MREATVIKVDGKWECRFMGKRGPSKKPITHKQLHKWLDDNIENPEQESNVMIPQNTNLTMLKYKDRSFKKEEAAFTPRKGANENRRKDVGREKKFARAPYNFIPLNKKVAFQASKADFDKFDKKRHTGYIKLEVKNLTPLFIRQISGDEKHFGYDDKYGIPGSSMRGMIRTICEVLSFGRFGKVNDVHLYFREMFGNTQLAQYYKNELDIAYDQTTRVSTSRALKAGWLKVEKGKERIYKTNGSGYRRYKPGSYREFTFQKMNGSFQFTSGHMNGKKYGYEFNLPSNISIPVNKDFSKAYKEDISRTEEVDKFYNKIRKKYPELGIPVFYKEENGEIVHYGHTMNYRLPYRKSIAQHIPDYLKKTSTMEDADLVQGLFGDDFDDGMIASRLAFGDLMSDNAKTYDMPQLLKILSSPKPTTFQHYLQQKNSDRKDNWNSDADIRGFKMYWHRKTSDKGTVDISWNEPNGTDKSKSHTERVKPIKPVAIFKGKIWFQNLSDIELGLLLMVLEPNFKVNNNEQIIHKIGLAKPLGLGSIQIKISDLKIFNVTKEGYYSSFAPESEKKYKAIEKETCKNDYDIACTQQISPDGGSIWDIDRLKALRVMMVWEDNVVQSNDWLQKTRYMEIEREGKPQNEKNEFKSRPILPMPTVVEKSKDEDFI